MLTLEPVKFNQGYPESEGLTLSTPLQGLNMFYAEKTYPRLELGAMILGIIFIAAIILLKRKKIDTLKPTSAAYKNEIALKMTLAQRYRDAGEYNHSLYLLNRVLIQGNQQENEEASLLIEQIQKMSHAPRH